MQWIGVQLKLESCVNLVDLLLDQVLLAYLNEWLLPLLLKYKLVRVCHCKSMLSCLSKYDLSFFRDLLLLELMIFSFLKVAN